MNSRKTQFCSKGHDKDITGRYKDGHCKICHVAVTMTYNKNNPRDPNLHKNMIWKRVGIINADGSLFTTIDFDRAYQIQQGKCGMCGKHSTELKRQLDADHDHKSGIFRGLLCSGCNKDLGIYEKIKNSAVKYLKDN